MIFRTTFFLILAIVATRAFSQTQPAANADPVVIVLSRTLQGSGAGQGFAIGDGTLIITGRHIVAPNSNEPGGFPVVISPYLGDACEARIIAEDPSTDLAVLKVSWPAHPAYPLADDRAVIDARRITVVSQFGKLMELTKNETGKLLPTWPEPPSSVTLPVDYIGVRSGMPRALRTLGAADVVVGWSGSPMLIDDTGAVGGCVTHMGGPALSAKETAGPFNRIEGYAVSLIRDLVPESDRVSLAAIPRAPPRPADADAALAIIFKAHIAHIHNPSEASIQAATEWTSIRPHSAYAFRLLGQTASVARQMAIAEEALNQAIELDPSSPAAYIYLAQLFLENKQPEKAMDAIRPALQRDPQNVPLVITACNILRPQKKHAECVELLKPIVAANPNSGLAWAYLAQEYRDTEQFTEALDAYDRAIQLLPDQSVLQLERGKTLEKVGRIDEAEAQLRKCAADFDDAMSHFFLAQFLIRNRPAQSSEALREAELAMARWTPASAITNAPIQALLRQLRGNSPATLPSTRPTGDFRL